MTSYNYRLLSVVRFGYVSFAVALGLASVSVGEDKAGSIEYANAEVEIVCTSQNPTRVLLTAAGAARIDFPEDSQAKQPPYTVVLPTDPDEVERLARSVRGLMETSALKFIARSDFPVDPGDLILGCSWSAERHSVRTSGETGTNFVVDGVKYEIGVVAMLDLADALHEFEMGEVFGKRSDYKKASECYANAIKDYCQWATERCRRYTKDAVFEPEVGTPTYEYRDGANKPATGHFDRNNPSKLPGLTEKQAAEFLRHVWKEWASEVDCSPHGALCIVRVNSKTFSAKSPTVSAEVIKLLQAQPWGSGPIRGEAWRAAPKLGMPIKHN